MNLRNLFCQINNADCTRWRLRIAVEKTAGEDAAAAGTDVTFTSTLGRYVSAGIICRVWFRQQWLSNYNVTVLAKQISRFF